MESRSPIRPAACAGTFYPQDPQQLRAAVQQYLAVAETNVVSDHSSGSIKAIIVPHAGYIYSAPIAASVYHLLRENAAIIRRIVMIGPAHREFVDGIATTPASGFETSLGTVSVDTECVKSSLQLPFVHFQDSAHQEEHCLEVQLPFLQEILHDFSIVPFLAGKVSPAQIAELLEQLWGGDETLILISSDLSHFLDHAAAQQLDQSTTIAIENLSPNDIESKQACGAIPIQGLLTLAQQRNLEPTTLDQRNSGDTAGSRERVVGYGAYIFCQQN